MDDGTDSGGEEGQRLAGLQLFAPRPHLRPAASEPQSVYFFPIHSPISLLLICFSTANEPEKSLLSLSTKPANKKTKPNPRTCRLDLDLDLDLSSFLISSVSQAQSGRTWRPSWEHLLNGFRWQRAVDHRHVDAGLFEGGALLQDARHAASAFRPQPSVHEELGAGILLGLQRPTKVGLPKTPNCVTFITKLDVHIVQKEQWNNNNLWISLESE